MFESNLINGCNDPNISPNCNNSKVVSSNHLGECSNECYTPFGRPGPMVVKVPVVLADCKIQIDIESDIRLEKEAFDVKTIDKHVCITQCHLVPHTNKVFISGHVQKNIQYSTVDCDNATSVSGSVLHSTFNIPFKCVTAVRFDKEPIFGSYCKRESSVLDKSMLCESNKEQSWQHYNDYYERIFCELEWSNILETDIFHGDRRCGGDFSKERCFRDITEKMVVYLRIKLLQNQPVYIGEPECKVDMIEDCNCKCGKHHKAERCSCNNQKQYDVCNDDIEIGCNSEMGVVGRLRGQKGC